MLTQLLNFIGTATDVRSIAAIVLGVLTTVVGHNSVIVKAVVDGVAGIIVLVDTFQVHKTKQAVANAAVTRANQAAAATASVRPAAAVVSSAPVSAG